MRGFKTLTDNIQIPTRSTKNSAGYDFYVPETITIKAGEKAMIPTYVSAYMNSDEVLLIFIRSSLGIKKGLVLNNQVGVIDSDYFSNPDTQGNIFISVTNSSDTDVTLEAGDRIAQGVFTKYLTCDNEEVITTSRSGGIGSTGN